MTILETNHPRIEAHRLDPGLLPSYIPERSTEARLVEPVLEAINTAVQDCSITAAQVFAGRIYVRKGENCVTAFGAPTNEHYDRDDGDVYLELGVIVPSYAEKPVLDAVQRVDAMCTNQALRDKRQLLVEARTRREAAQEAEARIQAEIDRLSPTKE